MGDDSNGGGGEAAPQQKGRALAALGMVGGRPAAVLLAKLAGGQRFPVRVRGIDELANLRIGESMRTEFCPDPRWSVALPHPRTHDHFAEARVILVVLLAQFVERGFGFFLVATRMFQPRAQLALRILAPGEHRKPAVIGAAFVGFASNAAV